MEVPCKTKNKTIIWPSNPIPGHSSFLIWKDTSTPISTAVLFTIPKTQKQQPEGPLTDEQIRKLWYTYTMEYYSAIK